MKRIRKGAALLLAVLLAGGWPAAPVRAESESELPGMRFRRWKSRRRS